MGEKGGCCSLKTALVVIGVVVVGMAFFSIGFLVSYYAFDSNSDSNVTDALTTPTPVVALTTVFGSSGFIITVWVTFENLVTNDKTEFLATTDFNTTQKTAYEVMRDLEKNDPRFQFTTKEHVDFGHFVTHVQGVEGNWNEKTYWGFLQRSDSGDCLINQGISTYVPSDGEHFVLSLLKYPNDLKSCTDKTTTPPEVIAIVYTVERNHTTTPVDDVFPDSISWNTTRKAFLQIMEDVQTANHTSFWFAVDVNQTVTQVQNSLATVDMHWMLLYRNVTGDCIITEGATVYVPANNDHLVLSLEQTDAHMAC